MTGTNAARVGIVDSHVHVWDSQVLTYPWLNAVPHLPRKVLPAEVSTDFAAAAIFVEADAEPGQAIREARWVSSLDWPTLVGIVAAADLRARGLDEELDALFNDCALLVGVRHILQAEPVDSIADLSLTAGLRHLGAQGLTFDACVTHEQLGALAALLDSVDETRVVIDHVGKPPVDAGLASPEGQAWAHNIRRLSSREATFVKLSGLSVESRSAEAYAREAPAFLAYAAECFGVNRCMLGSDAPVSTQLGPGGSFSDWVTLVRRVIGEDDWSAVSRTTAESLLERYSNIECPCWTRTS